MLSFHQTADCIFFSLYIFIMDSDDIELLFCVI